MLTVSISQHSSVHRGSCYEEGSGAKCTFVRICFILTWKVEVLTCIPCIWCGCVCVCGIEQIKLILNVAAPLMSSCHRSSVMTVSNTPLSLSAFVCENCNVVSCVHVLLEHIDVTMPADAEGLYDICCPSWSVL